MTIMTLQEFRATLSSTQPPDVAPLLRALWHDARGDREQAHTIAQDIESNDAAWVHAYLHRKEGDASNARYWYQRAGRDFYRSVLADEWDALVKGLLG